MTQQWWALSRGDLDTTVAQVGTNLAQMVIPVFLLLPVGISAGFSVTHLLPGYALGFLIGSLGLVVLAERLARREGRTNVTAHVYGNNVPAIIAAARHSAQVREILAGILTPRHPSQLYEAFLEGLLLFTLLILIRLKFKKPDGVTTGCFFILYPVMRIVGEFFREPDAPLTGSLTRGQFLSLFMFAIGAAFLWSARRKYLADRSP